MNQVIQTLLNHRSIRSYKEEMVKEEDVALIIQAAQAAPSSINGQQVSIIAVKDQARKAKIAELAGNQAWIEEAPVFLLFAADFYRAKLAAEKQGVELVITDSVEAIMVGSVDVGLAMGNAIAAAESLGLGIVPIGGVRRDPEGLIQLLELPEYVFPVAGLVLGYPNEEPPRKPRLPKAAVYHEESYQRDLRHLIDQYDEEMDAYMKKRTNGESTRSWSETIASFYQMVYYPNVNTALKQQGFKNE